MQQQTVPISINDDKGVLFQATHQELNYDTEMIRQLKTKIKEPENSKVTEFSCRTFPEDTAYSQEIAREHFEDIEASCSPRQIQSHSFKD